MDLSQRFEFVLLYATLQRYAPQAAREMDEIDPHCLSIEEHSQLAKGDLEPKHTRCDTRFKLDGGVLEAYKRPSELDSPPRFRRGDTWVYLLFRLDDGTVFGPVAFIHDQDLRRQRPWGHHAEYLNKSPEWMKLRRPAGPENPDYFSAKKMLEESDCSTRRATRFMMRFLSELPEDKLTELKKLNVPAVKPFTEDKIRTLIKDKRPDRESQSEIVGWTLTERRKKLKAVRDGEIDRRFLEEEPVENYDL